MFEPYLQIKNYKAKEHFLSEEKICYEIGFVNNGCFRTYYLADGKEINTYFAFENNFVADYDSFLQSKPSRYFIQALKDAEIVTFNLSALHNAYNQSQNWERFG
ncbi:MAG TPA: cyclic nucleotide-binding domain-containing protein, partial [Niabella sp.]|nr:cyclic nucleotide-binding domain-containing protein [Niabella sp.]